MNLPAYCLLPCLCISLSKYGKPFSCILLLQTGLINNFCQLMDPEGVKEELQHIRSLNVDGVVVDCWWGIVEAWTPKKYEWAVYREMFNIIREFGMKLQVIGI